MQKRDSMLKRHATLAATVLVLAAAAAAALAWYQTREPLSGPPVTTAAPSPAFGFLAARASDFPPPADGPLQWPRDHGMHPAQLGEYWMFAGVLRDEMQRAYGFHVLLLRLALQPEERRRPSAWAARDIYAARMEIAAAGQPPHSAERLSRAALGIAGADDDPLRMWLRDWQVVYDDTSRSFRLQASDGGRRMDLYLSLPAEDPEPLAVADARGYWFPRLAARGTLTLNGAQLAVTGDALLDRLWGRALPAGSGQLALSRIWITLDDGNALRCQQLRRVRGGGMPLEECLLRSPDGTSERLEAGRIVLEPMDSGWQILDGIGYPLQWRIEVDGYPYDLRVGPLSGTLATTSVTQPWSGTITVDGSTNGWGLLELSNFR